MGCCAAPAVSQVVEQEPCGTELPSLLNPGARATSRESRQKKGEVQRDSLKNWQLELLEISAELKEKLQDPQFVATRCDLDGSGDLDLHELRQAMRVFGMRNCSHHRDQERLRKLMGGQRRISKERFAEIVADSRQPTSWRTSDLDEHIQEELTWLLTTSQSVLLLFCNVLLFTSLCFRLCCLFSSRTCSATM